MHEVPEDVLLLSVLQYLLDSSLRYIIDLRLLLIHI
jgi:hypothetical protein